MEKVAERAGERIGKRIGKRIGMIAGNGRFPLLFAESAKGMGVSVTAVAHIGETEKTLSSYVDKIFWIRVGQLGKLIKIFKKEGIRDVVMTGGITKARIFSRARPDMRSLILLSRIREKTDDAILRAAASELEKEGLIVRESTLYLSPLLAESGQMTSRTPSKEEWEDIRFGFQVVRGVGQWDIGQCVVVKGKCVLAVEAVEGTDEAIRRGGRIARSGAIVVKAVKPRQDLRFDLPAIGPRTIATMTEVSATVLAVEAGKTLILDKKDTLASAEKAGISVIGVE